MKNRMDVPQEYEPVLPGKVKAHLTKKKAQETDTDAQTTWYQCVDLPNFWSKDGHKSYKQPGVSAVEAVLMDPENEGARMMPYNETLRQGKCQFTIKDGTMVPIRKDD